jgi:cytochrome c-type biogenesis protein CcmH/NrfF
MKNRYIALLLTFLAVVFFISACSSGASNPTPTATSNLDGATLIQERCSVCHPLSRAERSKHTAADWKLIVDRMIRRGAQLSPDEETKVVSYLTTNFGQ